MIRDFLSTYRKRRTAKADKVRRELVLDQQQSGHQEIIALLRRIDDNQQTCARQRGSEYTRRATREFRRFCLDVAGVLVAGAAACFLLWQQHTMQGQLNEMRDEQRPWVSATAEPASDFTLDDAGAHFQVKFVLNNSGHSPALRAWVIPNMYPLRQGINPIDEQKARCDKLRKRNPTRVLGITIFPGKPENTTMGLETMDRTSINLALSERASVDKFIIPVIGGCVVYEYGTGDIVHETGFIYKISRVDAANPTARFQIDPSVKVISMGDIEMESDATGGNFAD
jgi:hypothetical protein